MNTYNAFGNGCNTNIIGNYSYCNTFEPGACNVSFAPYTTGSSMKIQYLTIYQGSSTPIPVDLVTLNANYNQVLGLNLTGELVRKPVLG